MKENNDLLIAVLEHIKKQDEKILRLKNRYKALKYARHGYAVGTLAH